MQQNIPINGSLTFLGSVAGQASLSGQPFAGNLSLQLPNSLPTQGQVLTASFVNGLTVVFGWTTPQSGGGGAVTSVFGRTGDVVAATADYTVSQVTGAAPLASPTFTGTVTLPATVHGPSGTFTISANTASIVLANTGGITVTPASGTVIALGNARFTGALTDGSSGFGSTGTVGQLLSSTGGGSPTTLWISGSGNGTTFATAAANLSSAPAANVLAGDGAGNIENSGISINDLCLVMGATGVQATFPDAHTASGVITINGTTPVTITLSGNATFGGASTYVVQVSYKALHTTSGILAVANVSGTSFTIVSTDVVDTTSTVSWTAVGLA